MQNAVSYIVSNSDQVVAALLSVVGAASAVAALFGKQNNKWLEKIRSIINFLALNVGKAKNKE